MESYAKLCSWYKITKAAYVVGIIRQGEQVKKLKKKTGESGKTA